MGSRGRSLTQHEDLLACKLTILLNYANHPLYDVLASKLGPGNARDLHSPVMVPMLETIVLERSAPNTNCTVLVGLLTSPGAVW